MSTSGRRHHRRQKSHPFSVDEVDEELYADDEDDDHSDDDDEKKHTYSYKNSITGTPRDYINQSSNSNAMFTDTNANTASPMTSRGPKLTITLPQPMSPSSGGSGFLLNQLELPEMSRSPTHSEQSFMSLGMEDSRIGSRSGHISPYSKTWSASRPRHFHTHQEVHAKTATITEKLRAARYCVVVVGEEVCYPDIPAYTTPALGFWALREQGRQSELGKRMEDIWPTDVHMSFERLLDAGIFKHIISMNVDGLLVRCGVHPTNITEVQGNVLLERCQSCGCDYYRSYNTTTHTSKRLFTGRLCEDVTCFGKLEHSLVRCSQPSDLKAISVERMKKHLSAADLIICCGLTQTNIDALADMLPLLQNKDVGVCAMNNTKLIEYAEVNVLEHTKAFMGQLLQHLRMDVQAFHLPSTIPESIGLQQAIVNVSPHKHRKCVII